MNLTLELSGLNLERLLRAAGACGVLPAVLVPLYQAGMVSEEQILQALYAASGIGAVIG